MPTFKANDRWQDIVTAHWREVETLPGSNLECKVLVDARQFGDVEIWQAVEWLQQEDDLFRWVVQYCLHLFDRPERLKLLQQVALDPALAAAIFVIVPHLTDEEDAILYAAFEAEMPNLVARLADGTPGVRAKVPA